MGHSYRERRTVASTTSENLGGLTGSEEPETTTASWTDMKLAELREAAAEQGLDESGTKAELIKRLEANGK